MEAVPKPSTHHRKYVDLTGNPKSCQWGSICWGHYTSDDGLHWKHDGDQAVLKPSETYDKEGIFTGCFYPTGVNGQPGSLTVFYSSIKHLPIHWTIPYERNCAGLSAATSSDGGLSWQKIDHNPILEGEPDGLTVIGFRDPFVAEWPTMDQFRGARSLYGLLSGAIKDGGPAAFLYAVDPMDLTKWSYLGLLNDEPDRKIRPSHWYNDLGANWECVNFMTLSRGGIEWQVLTLGAEGCLPMGSEDVDTESNSATEVKSLWTAGVLTAGLDCPKLAMQHSGVLDHGSLYAASTYEHPTTGQRILWGWIKEEELSPERCQTKGWNGYLSLPRELFIFQTDHVLGTIKTCIEDIPGFKVMEPSHELIGGKTVQTLGIRPLPNLTGLRSKACQSWSDLCPTGHTLTQCLVPETVSSSWEMEVIINMQRCQSRAGLHLKQGSTGNSSQQSTLFFDPAEERLVLDRSRSNHESDIQKHELGGPFTLLVQEENGEEVVEKLQLRIFCDGDVLEVFANDRFAMAATTYSDSRQCWGISCFAEGSDGEDAVFESIKLWEDLESVYIS